MADLILNIEQGQSVDFTDISLGDITGYSWIFPGGFPSGSTGENPSVVYNNIGTFDVSLSTTDSYSVLNTITKIGVIKVDPETWGVNFQINSTPSRMGEVIDFENLSLGSPTYTEWTIPPGSGATGLTAGYKTDLNGISYKNWRLLTGSHEGSPGENYDSYSSLYSSSYFNTGSITKPIRIKKMGPPESYLENYNYVDSIGGGINFGSISSMPYGDFFNQYAGPTAHNSAGLSYTLTKRNTGPYLPGIPYPIYMDSGVSLIQLNLEDSFLFNWGLTGAYTTPEGLYYPHSNLEYASIIGRAYSAFNIKSGKIRVDQEVFNFAQRTSGTSNSIYGSIIDGKYVTPYADLGENIIEANPNYILIRDDYDSVYMWKSHISLFAFPTLGVGTGKYVTIANDVIDLLLSHPNGLPTPGYPPADKPTLSLVTSLDTHIRTSPEFFGQTLTYFDTNSFRATDPTAYTSIGKYPAIPSQWSLNKSANFQDLLSPNPNEFFRSNQLPLAIRILVKYMFSENPVNVDVYFGNFYPDPGFNAIPYYLPEKIDPLISPYNSPLLASAQGNDSPWGLAPSNRPSWIRVENNGNGLGVVGYINAYLSDSLVGLQPSELNYGGTGDLIARAVPQYILPTPYSDNNDGTYGTGPTGPYGLSLEVLCPSIEWVKIEELYGNEFWDTIGVPYPPYQNCPPILRNVPITWNYSRYTETEYILPHMDPGTINNLESAGYTYLGISSRMEPFSTGVLGMGPTELPFTTGVTFGGSINI